MNVLETELQNKKAELEKIYGIISLEIGTPLANIKSMADLAMLDASTVNNPFLTESIAFLQKQVEKTRQQLANLMEWASLEVKNYQFVAAKFNLSALLKTMYAEFVPKAENKNINLVLRADDDLFVEADSRMIGLVLQNLLSNAVKFSRKNDTIELFAEKHESTITVGVKDTGIGMGKAKAEAIFQPHRKNIQRGTANEGGFGLGMPVVKALLALHATEVVIETEMGKGCTVKFNLKTA